MSVVLFRKKNKFPEYTTYEADEYYYEEYINPNSSYKKIKNTSYDNYGSFDDIDDRRINLSTKVIVAIALYTSFLIIGIMSTTIVTNEIGEKEAIVVTVSMMEERESYYKIREHYHIIKNLINQVNELDMLFLQINDEELFSLSTQYQDLLPQIDKALPLARAIAVDPKYRNLKKQAESIYESIAIYLQKIGSALAEKNKITFDEAVTWRDKYFYDFEQFRVNMIEFAKMVRLEDQSLIEDLPEIFSINEIDSNLNVIEQPQTNKESDE